MKRYILYLFLLCSPIIVAQNVQTITTTEGGKLSEMINNPEQLTELTVLGWIDARDFFFLRDNCPNLINLNIKEVKIAAYGEYPANEIPKFALSRLKNTENWLDLRLSSDKQKMITPTDTISASKMTFRIDKTTDLSTIVLTADIPSGATILPNPETIKVEDGKLITFAVVSESGEWKNYQYYVTLDNWFTVIICADSEISMRDNTAEKISQYVNKAIRIDEYPAYTYSTYSFIRPKTEMMIMAGDMDLDRGGQLDLFDSAFKQVIDSGIPMITIYGNHDWEPDYWGDGSRGYTLDGLSSNKRTLNVVDTYIERSKGLGISDVHVFSSQYEQVNPFTFKYRDVRFYMGQNYWFQPPYKSTGLALVGWADATFYAPDDEIINPLTDSISTIWKDDAAVWVQHYPLNCADKWWMQQDDSGKSQPSNKGNWITAATKREKTKEMIRATQNPYFFAGHNHTEATYTHQHTDKTFKEYIAGYFPNGKAFMVLLREGVGVVEVKSIQL